MKVCCIYTTENYVSVKKPLKNLLDLHLGIAYIASSLSRAGFNVDLVVITPQTDFKTLLQAHVEYDPPALYCLTAVTTQFMLIVEIAKYIKATSPSSHVLIGGVHASLNPEQVAHHDCFDALCIGEGEDAVVAYATQLQKGTNPPKKINNLWIYDRGHSRWEKNPQAAFIPDLDRLPFLDIELWKPWAAGKSKLMTILIGRGCPNKCTYCSNHALARICPGRYVRFRSPQNVVDEIEALYRQNPTMEGILLRAETLSINLTYTKELCRALEAFNARQKRPLHFMISLSPRRELIENDTFLRSLKAANIRYVNMALESGSYKIRKEVLKRPHYHNNDIIQFCHMAKKLGIQVGLCNLIGLPGETLEDFKQTIACVRQCNPTHAYLFIFYPYPGTELYRRAKALNLFADDIVNPVSERKIARYSLPGFSRWQIQREFLLFYYKVYRGHIRGSKIAARIVREVIFIHPQLNAAFKRLANSAAMKPLIRRLSTDPQHQFIE